MNGAGPADLRASASWRSGLQRMSASSLQGARAALSYQRAGSQVTEGTEAGCSRPGLRAFAMRTHEGILPPLLHVAHLFAVRGVSMIDVASPASPSVRAGKRKRPWIDLRLVLADSTPEGRLTVRRDLYIAGARPHLARDAPSRGLGQPHAGRRRGRLVRQDHDDQRGHGGARREAPPGRQCEQWRVDPLGHPANPAVALARGARGGHSTAGPDGAARPDSPTQRGGSDRHRQRAQPLFAHAGGHPPRKGGDDSAPAAGPT